MVLYQLIKNTHFISFIHEHFQYLNKSRATRTEFFCKDLSSILSKLGIDIDVFLTTTDHYPTLRKTKGVFKIFDSGKQQILINVDSVLTTNTMLLVIAHELKHFYQNRKCSICTHNVTFHHHYEIDAHGFSFAVNLYLISNLFGLDFKETFQLFKTNPKKVLKRKLDLNIFQKISLWMMSNEKVIQEIDGSYDLYQLIYGSKEYNQFLKKTYKYYMELKY